MASNSLKTESTEDRIEGDTIILYDRNRLDSKTIKKVKIITPEGSYRFYKIKRTVKGNYLFN